MNELLNLELSSVLLTLLAYQAGVLLQKKTKSPVCNPILVGVVLVLLFMALTGLENKTYQAANVRLSWLMTPATIALAIPMYEQFQALKKNLKAILAGVAAGAVSCPVMLLVFGVLLNLDRTILISLLPKSVTTAIGVSLSEMFGGMGAVTTTVIIVTGIVANMMGVTFCRLFRITHPVAKGVAFGTAGHVIGTAKANELSPLIGAVSSLSLVVAGLLTAIMMPVVVSML